jgi:hypothetical protein
VTNYYWLTCDLCEADWIGEPYRKDGTTERCPECNSDELEIGREYHRKPPSLPYVVLLIPNFLLWAL